MGSLDGFFDAIEETVSSYSRIDERSEIHVVDPGSEAINHLRIRTQHFGEYHQSIVLSRCRRIAKQYGCELRVDDDVIVFVKP